jgi:hypothetical protein
VASLYIPVSAFNVLGGSWILFYGLGVVIEVILLAYILRSAWSWPRTPAVPAGPATTDLRQVVRGAGHCLAGRARQMCRGWCGVASLWPSQLS